MNKDLELTNLISELAKDTNLDISNLNRYKNKFENIYTDNYRHEYSEITKVLFSINDSEGRDYLSGKIKDIGNLIENEDIKKRVLKLWDHINLENIRLAELKKISEDTNKAFTEVNEVKEKYSKLEKQYSELEKHWNNIDIQANAVDKKLKKMDKDIDNSTSKSITILGIFSGIVMAFTGGLSFIASSLQNMNQVSIYRLILVITLISTAIFNIIFMLMYMIGRFTESYIGGKCNCDSRVEGCNDKKLRCVAIRYPLVVWFNIICLLSISTTSILYLVDRFNIITKVLKYNLWMGIISMVFITIMYFLLIVIGLFYIARIECMYEYVQSPLNLANKLGILKGRYVKKEKYSK